MDPVLVDDPDDRLGNALILTGATASGKSKLALELAERLGAELISMDSMAVYRGLDIASAKPGREDRQRVPHHLIDVLDPWESANVSWWLREAMRCAAEIRQRDRRPLFVGGTPLYLKALLHGLFDGPGADPQLRQRLESEAATLGPQILHERLTAIDPVQAEKLHPHDVRRVIRALEVWESSGQPLSEWQKQWPATASSAQPLSARCLWLDRPRQELYERINARVVQMLADGLIEEIAALHRLPQPISREAAQAVGYREITDLLHGECSAEVALERIQTRSRHFARRQLTWFRQMPQCRPVDESLTFVLWGLTGGSEKVQSAKVSTSPQSTPVI